MMIDGEYYVARNPNGHGDRRRGRDGRHARGAIEECKRWPRWSRAINREADQALNKAGGAIDGNLLPTRNQVEAERQGREPVGRA